MEKLSIFIIDANGKITMDVAPTDFGVFANTVYLADAGYVWYTTSYERDDIVTDPLLYDSGVSIVHSPGLDSHSRVPV